MVLPVSVPLLDHFAALSDPRQRAKVLYPLPEILLLVLSARLDEAGGAAIAAVLVHKGLDAGLAAALLALGPLTRGAFLRALGTRGRLAGAATVAVEAALALAAARLLSLSGWLAGAPVAADQLLRASRAALLPQAVASPFAAVSALVLLALALSTLWSAGARGWFAPLRHGPRVA